MRHNDAQLGKPEILFKDTQANIEAFSGLAEGSFAYATDIDKIGYFDGSNWIWGSLGETGQYRQFTYIVTAGDFSFVIDADGEPVMALQDLE